MNQKKGPLLHKTAAMDDHSVVEEGSLALEKRDLEQIQSIKDRLLTLLETRVREKHLVRQKKQNLSENHSVNWCLQLTKKDGIKHKKPLR